MKRIFCVLGFLCSLALYGQKVVVEKGKDTIYVGAANDTATISFKIEGATLVDLYPSLRIRVHSTDAAEKRDFALLDAYKTPVEEINITRVGNQQGSFYIYAAGGLKEAKTVHLETRLFDERRQIRGIVTLILTPVGKKPAVEEKPKPAKKDSLVFVQYNLINIQMYASDGIKADTVKKRKIGKDTQVPYLVNLTPASITRRSNTQYRIQVRTTENEIYFGIIDLNADFTFKDNDKLFLNGVAGAQFIRARDMFYIEKQDAGDTSKKATADNPEIKFPLD